MSGFLLALVWKGSHPSLPFHSAPWPELILILPNCKREPGPQEEEERDPDLLRTSHLLLILSVLWVYIVVVFDLLVLQEFDQVTNSRIGQRSSKISQWKFYGR